MGEWLHSIGHGWKRGWAVAAATWMAVVWTQAIRNLGMSMRRGGGGSRRAGTHVLKKRKDRSNKTQYFNGIFVWNASTERCKSSLLSPTSTCSQQIQTSITFPRENYICLSSGFKGGAERRERRGLVSLSLSFSVKLSIVCFIHSNSGDSPSNVFAVGIFLFQVLFPSG